MTNEELSLEEIESGKQNMSEKERTTLLQAYQNSQVKIWYQGSNEEVGFVKTLVNGISRLQNFKD